MGELIVNGIKIALMVGIIATFSTAIITLVNLLASITLGGIIGEVFGIISVFLPFNGQAVFSSIGVAVAAILSFMVANKIWNLLSTTITV